MNRDLSRLTAQEIEEYIKVELTLTRFKLLVESRRYIISKRNKNKEFIDAHNLDSQTIRETLLSLEIANYHDCLPHHRDASKEVYIFGKHLKLEHGIIIPIYVKFVFEKDGSHHGLISVVISFHEQERPLSTKFTDFKIKE